MTPLPFLRLLPLALLLPFGRSDGPADPISLRFAPEAGTSWTKTFASNASLEWDAMRVQMSGQPVPEQFLPEIELLVTAERELDVTDRYVSIADGRPTRLARTYDTITEVVSQEFSMTDPSGGEPIAERGDGEGESPLERRTVEFVWDAEAGEYSVAWQTASEGAPPLPKGLAEDLDLRSLLPADPVEAGDSWEVDADALWALIEPGGELGVEISGEGIQPDPEYDEESYEGRAELTFEDVREEDGVRVARITIEGEIVSEARGPGDLTDVPVADGEAKLEDTTIYGIEGVLMWNLDAGLFHSLEVDFDVSIESVTTAVDVDYQHTIEMSGSSKLSATCRRAE